MILRAFLYICIFLFRSSCLIAKYMDSVTQWLDDGSLITTVQTFMRERENVKWCICSPLRAVGHSQFLCVYLFISVFLTFTICLNSSTRHTWSGLPLWCVNLTPCMVCVVHFREVSVCPEMMSYRFEFRYSCLPCFSKMYRQPNTFPIFLFVHSCVHLEDSLATLIFDSLT